jgi:hypothetical protein
MALDNFLSVTGRLSLESLLFASLLYPDLILQKHSSDQG